MVKGIDFNLSNFNPLQNLKESGKKDNSKIVIDFRQGVRENNNGEEALSPSQILKLLKELDVKKTNQPSLNPNKEDDKSPLNSNGTLKDGWEYNTKTGHYREKCEISVYREGDADYSDGKSIRRSNGEQTTEYTPYIDDYEPTFEIGEDGRLVQTGKVKKFSPILYD